MILMGTNENDRTTFGLATSPDGRKWTLLPETRVVKARGTHRPVGLFVSPAFELTEKLSCDESCYRLRPFSSASRRINRD